MIAFNLIERERGETRQSGRGWAVFTAQWCMEPKKLDSLGMILPKSKTVELMERVQQRHPPTKLLTYGFDPVHLESFE